MRTASILKHQLIFLSLLLLSIYGHSQCTVDIDIAEDTIVYFVDGDVELTANDGLSTYSWSRLSDSWSATGQTVYIQESGVYYAVGRDNTGCISRDTIVIQFIERPVLNLGNDTTLCEGQTLTLDAGDNLILFEWQDGSTNRTFEVTEAGTYYVTATYNENDNLVRNGSFERGNTGFVSDYDYGTSYGHYLITPTSSDIYRPALRDCDDPSIAGGNVMAIDGSETLEAVVWQQTITIEPNTLYNFSTLISNIDPREINEPILQFKINNTLLGDEFEVSNRTCQWEEFNILWNSGSLTSATISIVNMNNQPNGNDFAFDDIFFGRTIQLTDTIVVDYVESPTIVLADVSICDGETAELGLTNPATYSYEWNTGANTPSITTTTEGTYTVTVSNSLCAMVESAMVEVHHCGDVVPCDGDYYLSTGSDSRTTLHRLDLTETEVEFVQIGNPTQPGYNALGYNRVDSYLYATSRADNQILRIYNDGYAEPIGELADIDIGGYYAADFNGEGEYVVINNQNGLRTLYYIDVTTRPPSLIRSLPTTINNWVADIAIQPGTGDIYTYVNSRLMKVDAQTGTTETIGPNNNGRPGILGSLWFDAFGTLWAYGEANYDGGDNQRTLFRFDVSTGSYEQITTGPLASGTDGAACPYTVVMELTTDKRTYLEGETVNFTLRILNNTYLDIADLTLSDILPPYLQITDIPSSFLSGSLLAGTGLGTTRFEYNNLNLPAGESTLNFSAVLSCIVEDSIPMRTQALLEGLPDRFGVFAVSDFPSTIEPKDSTLWSVYDMEETTISISDNEVCAPSPISLEATSAYPNVTITTPISTLTSNSTTLNIPSTTTQHSGWYVVTVENNTCIKQDSVELTVYEPPTVHLDDQTICEGENTTISIPNSYDQINWNNGRTSNSITVSTSGFYSVTVQNAICSDRDTMELTVTPLPVFDLGSDQTYCSDAIDLFETHVVADSYIWSTGATTPNIMVTQSGKYILTITKDNCSYADSVNITIAEDIVINIRDTTICGLDNTILTPGSGFSSYQWSTLENTPSITVNQSGIYSVTVSDGICTAEDAAEITIIPPVVPELSIAEDTNNICPRVPVLISTVYSSGEGSNPIYEWMINGTLVNGSGTSLRIDTLTTDARITATLINNDYCVEPHEATDEVIINVIPIVSPTIDLQAIPSAPCEFTPTTFVAQTQHAGSSGIFEWFVNGIRVTGNTAMISSDTLSGNSEVVVRLTSSEQCPNPRTVQDNYFILPSPDPILEIPPHICLEDDSFVIEPENLRNSGGGFEPINNSPVYLLSNDYIFDPGLAGIGDHTIAIEWTDNNGCKARTSADITVHDIDEPQVDPYKEDLVSIQPYKDFTAIGVGTIYWYDFDFNEIVQSDYFDPNHNCPTGTCQSQYWVRQRLDPYGCWSDYVPVEYVMTNCEVPSPIVKDTIICDYDPIPTINAEINTNWPTGDPGGSTVLFWYEDMTSTANIYNGPNGITPESYDTPQEYYVSQYNSALNCFSGRRRVSMFVKSAAPPIINDQTKCATDALDPFHVVSPYPLKWYDSPTAPTPFLENGTYTPTTTVSDTYYVSQIQNGCESPRTEVNLIIKPQPPAPNLLPDENCNFSDVTHSLTAFIAQGVTIEWYNDDDVLIGNNGLLTLNESILNKNEETFFKARVIVNECPSEFNSTAYTLYTIPNAPDIIGIEQLCEGSTYEDLQVETSVPTDKVEWFNSDEELIYTGFSYRPELNEFGSYRYSAVAWNRYCPSKIGTHTIVVQSTPKPKALGPQKVCINTAERYSVVNPKNGTTYNWGRYPADNENIVVKRTGVSNIVEITFTKQGVDTLILYEETAFGCPGTDTLEVYVADFPVADFNYNLNMSEGLVEFYNMSEEVTLTDFGIEIDLESNFRWNFGKTKYDTVFQSFADKYNDTTVKYKYGYYNVFLEAESEYGCIDTITKTVFVDAEFALYFPNAVCPVHPSGQIAVFHPRGFGLEEYRVWIYDKWGNLIWFSDQLRYGQPKEMWDCRYNGTIVQQGYYIWKAEAKFANGEWWQGQKTRKGELSKMGDIFVFY